MINTEEQLLEFLETKTIYFPKIQEFESFITKFNIKPHTYGRCDSCVHYGYFIFMYNNSPSFYFINELRGGTIENEALYWGCGVSTKKVVHYSKVLSKILKYNRGIYNVLCG